MGALWGGKELLLQLMRAVRGASMYRKPVSPEPISLRDRPRTKPGRLRAQEEEVKEGDSAIKVVGRAPDLLLPSRTGSARQRHTNTPRAKEGIKISCVSLSHTLLNTEEASLFPFSLLYAAPLSGRRRREQHSPWLLESHSSRQRRRRRRPLWVGGERRKRMENFPPYSLCHRKITKMCVCAEKENPERERTERESNVLPIPTIGTH